MATQNHIIYLPGIGDAHSYGQRQAIWFWRFFGVRAHYYRVGWADGEAFPPKLARLVEQIDGLVAAGHRVSLVGVSAGASAAIAAYGERPDSIARVVFVCGKIGNTRAIGEAYYKANPAFIGSIARMNLVIPTLNVADRGKMLSIHPLSDNTVPIADTYLEGAAVSVIPSHGHMMSIGYAITLGSRKIIQFIKTADDTYS